MGYAGEEQEGWEGMMGSGSARAKDFGAEGRWDAQFHLFLQRHEKKAKELEGRIGSAEAVELLLDDGAIPLEAKRALAPLVRGADDRRESLERAIREYPHLALAAVLESAPGHLERLRRESLERARALGAGLRRLKALGAPAEGEPEPARRRAPKAR